MTWCLAIDAAPDSLWMLHLEGQLSYSPSRPQIPTVPWQTMIVHTELPSDVLSMNRSAEKLPREIFADVQSFLRSLSRAQKENLWLFCQVFMSSSPLCGSFGQYVTGTTLFSPYREQVGIFLPLNF